MKHGDTSLEVRFRAASRLLETHEHDPMLDWPLRRWRRTGDWNLPTRMLNQNLRTILQTPFSKIAQIRWIGPVRLEQLVVLLDRARNALNTDRADGFGKVHEGTLSEQRDTVNDEPGFLSQAAREVYFLGVANTPWWELNDRDWNSVVQLIRYHDLERFPLGRFASSLRDLHRSLWQERISNFSQRSFSQLFEMKGYCHVKLTQSVGLIYNLAYLLSRLPADSDIQTAVFPTTITEANRWLTQWQFGEAEKLPDVPSILEYFVKPLLIQVERDISGRVSAIAKRRIGDGGEPETYREISKDFGVTPNRIRTLIPPAVLVFDVRWPEGRDLLQRVCEQLSVQKKRTSNNNSCCGFPRCFSNHGRPRLRIPAGDFPDPMVKRNLPIDRLGDGYGGDCPTFVWLVAGATFAVERSRIDAKFASISVGGRKAVIYSGRFIRVRYDIEISVASFAKSTGFWRSPVWPENAPCVPST